MKNIFFFFLLFHSCFLHAQTADSMLVVYPDSSRQWLKILVFRNDTINGNEYALYADDTSKRAYELNYYYGWITGKYRKYYPNGTLMEMAVYQKGKKNGDYSYYGPDGTLLIKGIYKNDIKHGYWSDLKCKTYGRYRHGLKSGKWRWYYTTLSYYAYHYKAGKLVKAEHELPPCLIND